MMFEDPDDIIYERLKQICLYLILPFILALLLLCYLVTLPLYMLGCLFTKPCAWLD